MLETALSVKLELRPMLDMYLRKNFFRNRERRAREKERERGARERVREISVNKRKEGEGETAGECEMIVTRRREGGREKERD